jgi:hypothetical protein
VKKATNNISIPLTGIIVKTYVLVSLAWSKADAEYRKIKVTPTNTKFPVLSKTAQPAI